MHNYDYYLPDVQAEQGNLFRLVSEASYNLSKFAQKYFNSAIHKSIDRHEPRFVTMSAEDLYDLTVNLNVEYGKPDAYATWYGQFYAYMNSELGIPTEVLYSVFPIARLYTMFYIDYTELLKTMLHDDFYTHFFTEADTLLSPDTPSLFKINGETFSSVTQYMYYRKARIAKQHTLAENIQTTTNIVKIQSIASNIVDKEKKWEVIRDSVLYTALYNKFLQNPELADKVSEHKNKLLFYVSKKDMHWSIGLPTLSKDVRNPDHWKGQNALGITYMKVLQQL